MVCKRRSVTPVSLGQDQLIARLNSDSQAYGDDFAHLLNDGVGIVEARKADA